MSGYSLFRILKYGSSKQIKKIMLSTLIMSMAIGLFSGFAYIKDLLVEKNWYKTNAVVVNYDISNSKNVLTELKYNYKKDYTVKVKGYAYYTGINSNIPIYVNKKNPTEIKIEKRLFIISETLFICSIVFVGIILFFMLPVYLLKRIKENKFYA